MKGRKNLWPALGGLLREPLLPHQIEAAQFLAERNKALLADDMGLGKTVEALAACELRRRTSPEMTVLVVCPKSLVATWCTAIHRFIGAAVSTTASVGEEPYTVLHFEALARERAALRKRGFSVLVVDEAHLVKNPDTKRAQSIRKLSMPIRYFLTGTPIVNDVCDIWGIFNLLDRTILGQRKEYERRHLIFHGQRGATGLIALSKQIAPYVLRRDRHVLSQSLPPRQDCVIRVPMNEAQREEHRDVLVRLMQLLRGKSGPWKRDVARMHGLMTNARLAAHGLGLTKSQSNKIQKVLEIVSSCPGEKVVIYVEWIELQRQVAEALSGAGVGVIRLNGKLTQREFEGRLAAFEADPCARVMICTSVGNVGLNLQHATVAIHLNVSWSPSQMDQQVARLHRFGQKRPVKVFTLVAQNSFEESMLKSVDYKSAISNALFSGDVDTVLRSDQLIAAAEASTGEMVTSVLRLPLAPPDWSLLRAIGQVLPDILAAASANPSRPVGEVLTDIESLLKAKIWIPSPKAISA